MSKIREIRNLIGKNKIEEALGILLNLEIKGNLRDNILLQTANFRDLSEKQISGIIKEEDYFVIKNKIFRSILTCLAEFENQAPTLSQEGTILDIFERENNIFLKYQYHTKQLTFLNKDYFPSTPRDKSFVVFLRTSNRKLSETEYLNGVRISTQLVKIDLSTLQEEIIVRGCSNVNEKAKIYNSDQLPFDYICCIEKPFVTPDGGKVYYNIEAWTTSAAIVYYDNFQKKNFYFRSGTLKGVNHQGNVIISETFIDESKDRYVQDVLYGAFSSYST